MTPAIVYTAPTQLNRLTTLWTQLQTQSPGHPLTHLWTGFGCNPSTPNPVLFFRTAAHRSLLRHFPAWLLELESRSTGTAQPPAANATTTAASSEPFSKTKPARPGSYPPTT